MKPFDEVIETLQRLGLQPRKSGDGYSAFCPIHEADGKGHKPSLALKVGDTQPVIVNCHAGCDGLEILKALGVHNGTEHPSAPRIVATYQYRDASGKVLFEKIRKEPKEFLIRHPVALGGSWVWKKPDLREFPLYRLPEIRKAVAAGETVWIVEGEKDADRLAALGLVATTNFEGAAQPNQRPKWKREYTAQLTGASRVVLLPDNDEPGRAHMAHIAEQLRGIATDLRWLELPDLPPKGDVSDWLNTGHAIAELEALGTSAPPPTAASTPKSVISPACRNKIDTSLPSLSSQSITYNLTLEGLSLTSLTTEVPFLHDFDEKGRPTLIESKVAATFSDCLKGRFAFCREALRWHTFIGTHWHAINTGVMDELITRMLFAGATEGFSARRVPAVLSLLTKGLLPLPEHQGSDVLPFANGLLRLDTHELTPTTPDNALIWCLPYAYDPKADCPNVKTWLLRAVDDDVETLEFLRAWLAALLTGRADLQKFLHLFGPGGTGKGAFTRLAELLIGTHNATVTDLRNLEQNRFETASLYGKRLVCITDTSKYGGSVDVFKALTGQDSLRLERKHQQPGATFRFGGLVLLASNEALQTTDYTSALERRRLTVEFKRLVSDAERADWNARGGEDAILHQEIPGVVNWCLALSREEVTQRLTHQPRRVTQANREALRSNNPIADWLIENTIPHPGASIKIGHHRPVCESGRTYFECADERLYPNYLTWCQHTKREPLALRRFSGLVVDMARSLGVDVLKFTSGKGAHLKGLRLRREDEAPHEWLGSEVLSEGLVREVRDSDEKQLSNSLNIIRMREVRDFSNFYSYMERMPPSNKERFE